MKTGYYIQLLTPSTMKLLGSTKHKITENITKSLSGKYKQKLLDHAK